MSYIGIDPGESGAIAVFTSDDILIADWFSVYEYDAIIKKYKNHTIIIEHCQYTPQIKGKGAFTFGKNFGTILGLLIANQVKYVEVLPQLWKKEFHLIKKEKLDSIEMAMSLFPQCSAMLKLKTKHGRSEAILLAEYGRRKNL